MALTQAVWVCPCCGAELVVIAEVLPPAEAVVKPKPKRRRTRAEMRAMRDGAREQRERQQAEEERLGSLAGATARDSAKGAGRENPKGLE